LKEREFLIAEARIEQDLKNISKIEQELKGYEIYPNLHIENLKGFSLEDV